MRRFLAIRTQRLAYIHILLLTVLLLRCPTTTGCQTADTAGALDAGTRASTAAAGCCKGYCCASMLQSS
jgi:hypothetical protein